MVGWKERKKFSGRRSGRVPEEDPERGPGQRGSRMKRIRTIEKEGLPKEDPEENNDDVGILLMKRLLPTSPVLPPDDCDGQPHPSHCFVMVKNFHFDEEFVSTAFFSMEILVVFGTGPGVLIWGRFGRKMKDMEFMMKGSVTGRKGMKKRDDAAARYTLLIL
ncbi:hypothetical protein Tco_0922031 [Tanacetum coccineum]|uniref:Uncharacterized protein n=1 Tax=Tanacetum coccineum TaxID=301880 RepID=A0ABQ5CYN3_9ASTR